MNGPIPARAVTGLLAEILNALDAGHGQALPARTAHVVRALRHLLAGPAPAEGDLIAVTAILTAHLAETPAAAPRLHAVGGPPTWKLWRPGVGAIARFLVLAAEPPPVRGGD
jgi:hypothetical protein